MGFRKDAYATVWEVDPASDTYTKARISVSRRNKQTGEYETDFSGFVSFVGTATAKKAAGLKEKDRIRLGDVDVTTRYDKEKGVLYTNYKVFTFDSPENRESEDNDEPARSAAADSGLIDDSNLPF